MSRPDRTYTVLFSWIQSHQPSMVTKKVRTILTPEETKNWCVEQNILTENEISKLKQIKKLNESFTTEQIRNWCVEQDIIERDEKLRKLGL